MTIDNKTLAEIQAEVTAWADEVLPDRTVGGMVIKMVEELGEVAKDPSDPLQLADMIILLVDIADQYDINLSEAVSNRMHINRIKRWKSNRHTGAKERVEQ